jgi:hypothetical protein
MYERDLGNRRKWDLLFGAAERAGLEVHAVPSRWGGLVAGWPGAPSLFSATHPETWMLYEDGSPNFRGTWGPMSSVHHEATGEHFRECLDVILEYPLAGIIWDEPKPLIHVDHSPAAKARAPGGDTAGAGAEWNVDSVADFFEMAGRHAKSKRPAVKLTMFLYSWLDGYVVERTAAIPTLDYYGCDGRPWTLEEDSELRDDPAGKVLLPKMDRFLDAARANGKAGFVLIETQGLPPEACPAIDRRLPEVLDRGTDHVAYYYYGGALEDAERLMEIQARHLRAAVSG